MDMPLGLLDKIDYKLSIIALHETGTIPINNADILFGKPVIDLRKKVVEIFSSSQNWRSKNFCALGAGGGGAKPKNCNLFAERQVFVQYSASHSKFS